MTSDNKKNSVGRPLKYKTVEEMQVLIDRYFAKQVSEGRPLTVTGLARALGMDRSQLIEYGEKNEYSNAIKEAKMIVQEFSEETLYTARNPVGAIFNLKNNWGWKDKQDIDLNTNINMADMLKAARSRVDSID